MQKKMEAIMKRLEDLYGCKYTEADKAAWAREVKPKISSKNLINMAVELLLRGEDRKYMKKPCPADMLHYLAKARAELIREQQESVKNEEFRHAGLTQEEILNKGKGHKSPYVRAWIENVQELLDHKISHSVWEIRQNVIDQAWKGNKPVPDSQ